MLHRYRGIHRLGKMDDVIATRGSLIRNEKADGDTVEKNDEFVSLPSRETLKVGLFHEGR